MWTLFLDHGRVTYLFSFLLYLGPLAFGRLVPQSVEWNLCSLSSPCLARWAQKLTLAPGSLLYTGFLSWRDPYRMQRQDTTDSTGLALFLWWSNRLSVRPQQDKPSTQALCSCLMCTSSKWSKHRHPPFNFGVVC